LPSDSDIYIVLMFFTPEFLLYLNQISFIFLSSICYFIVAAHEIYFHHNLSASFIFGLDSSRSRTLVIITTTTTIVKIINRQQKDESYYVIKSKEQKKTNISLKCVYSIVFISKTIHFVNCSNRDII